MLTQSLNANPIEQQVTAKVKPELTGCTLADYVNLPAALSPWLCEPLIPENGLVTLYGPPKVRKSFFAIQLCRSLALGIPFLGYKVERPRRCYYLQLDTARILWQQRFQKLLTDPKLFPKEAQENIIITDRLQAPSPFNINDERCQHWLMSEVAKFKPDIVIIDVWRKVFAGSEDKTEVIEPTIVNLQRSCDPAAVLVITHARKINPEHDGGVLGELRGSGHLVASCDTILRLMPSTKTKPVRLSFEGRATEAEVLDLQDEENLFFTTASASSFEGMILVALDLENATDTQRATKLAEMSGKTLSACKSAISRYRKRLESGL